MIIAFGADHAGFELKQHLLCIAREWGYETIDVGTHGPESVDYPEFGEAAARAVTEGRAGLGVVVCSNGVGISITANKVPGVRCALCHSGWGAARARAHADANMLALGAWETGRGVAEEVLRSFLETPFEGGRHERRVAQMMDVERRSLS